MLELRGINYVVRADTASGEAGITRVAQNLVRAEKAANQSSSAMLQFGKYGETTARQLQALGYQTTDIFTQLAGGQSPFLVLLQQGGQLRDQFGGFGNVFKAVGQVLTVGRVAALGAAAAVGTLAYAMFQGHQESEEFRKSVALTGNAAGLTAGRFEVMAESIARFSGNTIGKSREALQGLASSGEFTGETLTAAGRAAVVMQQLTGESIGDVVKRFAGLRDNVAQWSVAANKSYNFLTLAQFEQIRTLESQGNAQEAARVSLDALSNVMEQRTAPVLGTLERGWQAVKNAASDAFDAIKSVGRDATLEEKLSKISKRIGPGENSENPYFKRFTLPDLRDQQAALQEQLRMGKSGADRAARDAAEQQEAIEKASKAHVDATLRIEQASFDKRLAQYEQGLQQFARLEQQAFDRGDRTQREQRDVGYSVALARLDAEKARLEEQVSVERRRVVEKPLEVKTQQAAVIAGETKIVELLTRRAALMAEIAIATAREGESARTQFRLSEIPRDTGVNRLLEERQIAARKGADAILEVNRQLAIELVADEATRGRLVIDEEARHLRERLQLQTLSVDDRKAVEEGFATWRLLRETQLGEQLKPEWKKQLDLYSDSERFRRESFDRLMNASQQTAEDTFVAIAAHGEFSVKRMVSVINEELARIGWRKFLAKPASEAFEFLFSLLGLGGGGGGGLTTGDFARLDRVGVGHAGGIAGSLTQSRSVSPLAFAGAPRYHRGGLVGEAADNELEGQAETVGHRPGSSRWGQARQCPMAGIPPATTADRQQACAARDGPPPKGLVRLRFLGYAPGLKAWRELRRTQCSRVKRSIGYWRAGLLRPTVDLSLRC